MFKENKIIFRIFPSADLNLPSNQNGHIEETKNKKETKETPEKNLEETKRSNERELKRLEQRANEIFRNGKNLLEKDSQDEMDLLVEDFNKAITDGDIETAILNMEAISDLIDFAPESVESHARAIQKLNSAKEVGLFDESKISIISSEEDKNIPERQFKIITEESGMFPGGIIMKMDDLNSLLFRKGLTKENLERTYLEMASREINKLFERSEENLPGEHKEILSKALTETEKKEKINKPANFLDTATLLDQQIDEEAEKELWEKYVETHKINIESGKYNGKPLKFTDEPIKYEFPYENSSPSSSAPKQNPETLTEEKPDTSLLLKLTENKKEISPKLESKLKELFTEKYKELPLETRSETINLALRQTLLYYSRKLTLAQINTTKRVFETKQVPNFVIY
ncbi:MAG: hypothetical protein RBS56_02600 [Candidatus Gracilibacteria bacterium]|jgi:hypothetical protein|nr:hypothetical protein [Candidatus Gracilibacteria bacterium]